MKFSLMQNPQDNIDLLNIDKIIFEKSNRIKELTEEIVKKDSELEILDEDIQELHRKIKKKNNEITNLEQLVRQKDKDLDELRQIHNNGIITKSSKSQKRGEFKKIIIASIFLIQREGIKKYLLTVKDKIRKKEFKLNTINSSNSSLSSSEKDRVELIKKIQDNHKNQLKIRSSSKSDLQNDRFIISDDNELV